MDTLLDSVSLLTQAAYFLFFAAALWCEYRIKTLAALRRASQHYWTATALVVLVLVIHVVGLASGTSVWQVVVNALTVPACVACAVLTDRKRDRRVLEDLGREL